MDTATRLHAAFLTQKRVVTALFFREMRTRFGQSRLGYIWALGEPIVHVATLSAIFSFMGRAPALGTSMAVFFFTGIIPFLFFRNITSRVRNAVDANRALLNYPPVRPIDTILARAFLEWATMTLSTLVLGVCLYLIALPIVPDNPLLLVWSFIVASLLGFGLGLLDAGLASMFKSWLTVSGWLQRVLYFVSGIFFVVDFLPPVARDVLIWIPTVHVIAMVRTAHFPGYTSDVLNPLYPVLWALGLMAVGLLLERAMRRRREA